MQSLFKSPSRLFSALLCLCLALASTQYACAQDSGGAAPSASGGSDNVPYYMSLFGGAAFGAGLGSLSHSNSAIGKGMLIGGGSTSSLYLFLRGRDSYSAPGGSRAGNVHYLVSYTTLGTGLGWSAGNNTRGAAIGAAFGFGLAALKLSFRH